MRTTLYKEAIEIFGGEQQLIVAIEELSELQKEITKALRGKKNEEAIIEEMADVSIMLEQLFWIFKIQETKVMQKVKEKNERLANLIEEKREKNERF